MVLLMPLMNWPLSPSVDCCYDFSLLSIAAATVTTRLTAVLPMLTPSPLLLLGWLLVHTISPDKVSHWPLPCVASTLSLSLQSPSHWVIAPVALLHHSIIFAIVASLLLHHCHLNHCHCIIPIALPLCNQPSCSCCHAITPVTTPSLPHKCPHIIILSLLQPCHCHQSMFCSLMLSLMLFCCHCAVDQCLSSMSSLSLSCVAVLSTTVHHWCHHCCFCIVDVPPILLSLPHHCCAHPCHLQMLLALKNNIAHKGHHPPCPFFTRWIQVI